MLTLRLTKRFAMQCLNPVEKGGISMRKLALMLGAALALVPVTAFAGDQNAADHPAHHAGANAKFPMKADEFRAKVEARLQKSKDRLEAHLKKKNVPEDRAKEARAKLAESTSEIRKVVDKVTADGTVTKEEAREVRQKAKEMRVAHKPHKK
jgi:hypothetical protein